MIDFIAHLTRQAAVSRGFFGPGPRTKGVTEHIGKELVEIEKCYSCPEEELPYATIPRIDCAASVEHSRHMVAATEWVDVSILATDGLLRAISAANPNKRFHWVATVAVEMIVAKQGKNELRSWPDWRTADPDAAIEHVRGKHD